jgi:hypothetical protein
MLTELDHSRTIDIPENPANQSNIIMMGDPLLYLVLATGPGNPPAVRFFASGSVRFVSKPGQKPEPQCLGGVDTRTGHKPAVFWPGCTRPTVPNYGSCNFGSN